MKTRMMSLLAMVMLIVVAAWGEDYKVLDRSEKKVPSWLHDLPKGTILVEVERPLLGDAQSAAELEVKRRIIQAVATNISHSSTQQASETWANDTHDYLEKFSMETETNAATLPFLSGISLSRANATYWEKREEKKTKRNYYVFSVLYPLSESELSQMIADFERTDKAKSEELAALRAGIDQVDSSDAIQDAVGRLEALQAYFFDKVRRAEAQAVMKSYNQLYKGLTLSGNFENGKLVCRVRLDGKPFKVTARPTLKSNCASGLRAEHSRDGLWFIVTYNDEDCLANEENWIEVSLNIRTARLHEKFVF